MFLFEYLIKLLLGNSSTLFMGLFIVIFGYYGWLLWNINKLLQDNSEKAEMQSQQLAKINEELEKVYNFVDRDLYQKLKQIEDEVERFDLEKIRDNIVAEIKEEADEVKETVKILLSRSLKMKRDDLLKITGQGEDEVQNIDQQT